MKKRAELIGLFLLLLPILAACSPPTAVSQPAEPTNPPPSTAADHEHTADTPAHVHLDDGSIVSTEGSEPLQDDIWELLLAGDPIAVGEANDSVETAVFTIPTMF